MPVYEFKNKETGEIEEHIMKYSDKEQFIKDNPHLESGIFTAPPINYSGQAAQSLLGRAGDGWKEVQSRIKDGMPPKDRHLIKTK